MDKPLKSVYHSTTELGFAIEHLRQAARDLSEIKTRMIKMYTRTVHIEGDDLHQALEHLDILMGKLDRELTRRSTPTAKDYPNRKDHRKPTNPDHGNRKHSTAKRAARAKEQVAEYWKHATKEPLRASSIYWW